MVQSHVTSRKFRNAALCLAALGLVLLAARPARAGQPGERVRWWVGADFGAGGLRQTVPGVFDETQPRFFMTFDGGVAVSPQLLIGAEVGGWLNYDSGAGVMLVFATARIYPSKMSAFHIRLGGGAVNDWDASPDGNLSFWGTGWEIGVGYDVRVRRHIYLTPFLAYYSSRVEGMDQSAITGGLGIVWR
jgi:hypothetical protein